MIGPRSGESTHTHPVKKRTILLVEDDLTTRKLIAHILEAADYEVMQSSEGRFAIDIAKTCSPSLILVDVMLPDMRGTELVEQLRHHSSGSKVKVLFLTGLLAKRSQSQEKVYFEIKGSKYLALSKPVKKEQLLAEIARLVGETNAEDEHAAAGSAKASPPAKNDTADPEVETAT